MKYGIVIGSFNHQSAVALNVACLRKLNGDEMPILLSDDHSHNQERLQEIAAKYPNVTLRVNERRMGLDGYNASGDLSAFYEGLLWAKSLGLQTLCKLSQRFVVHGQQHNGWVAEWSEKMLNRNLAAATRNCHEGPVTFLCRSECVLMDVAKWTQPEVLEEMEPQGPRGGEGHIMAVIRKYFGGRFLPLRIMGVQRCSPCPGLLWHCCHHEAAYRALADQMGIEWHHDVGGPSWRTAKGAATVPA